MENTCRIDEGHIFSVEDEILYIRWKVEELLRKGYGVEFIITYREDDFWCYYVTEFLNNMKKQ